MIQTYTNIHQRLLSPAVGRISEVCLIETDGTADLPVYLEWLRTMDISRGVLLLVNVPEYSAAAREILREISARGIEIVPVHMAHTVNKKAGTPHSYPMAAADLLLGAAGQDGRRTLYIGEYNHHGYQALRHDHRFRTAVRRLGYQTIACRDGGLPSLEGGDCLLVDGHLLAGRRTEQRFGAHAARDIRQFYQLGGEVQIHFTGVADPSPAGGLYHLDLYLAYGGRDAAGRHRFLAGYIDAESIGDAVIEEMRAQLDHFRVAVMDTLRTCYGSDWVLIPVPIIVCDIYRVSPLNGITEIVNGEVRYYCPWPKFVNAKTHPEYDIQQRVTGAMQRAWDILSDTLGAAALVRCDVPIHYMTGSGQSLHCTVGIIGREG